MNPEIVEKFRYISSQVKEQKISSYKGLMTCRYGYGRAIEKATQGEMGQDFLGVYIKDDICNFTLCKGIGKKDQKSLASRNLGNMLMEWLDTTEDWSSAGFLSFLKNTAPLSLADLNTGTTQEENLAFMGKVFEEMQLQDLDAMYICGRLELPTLERPIGRIWMAWQGDSRLKYWRDELEVSQYFKQTMTTDEWWSASDGPVGGAPHVYQSRLEYGMPMRLQLYTEGLSDLDPIGDWLPDEQIQILFDAPHTDGLRDDAGFLEFKW